MKFHQPSLFVQVSEEIVPVIAGAVLGVYFLFFLIAMNPGVCS